VRCYLHSLPACVQGLLHAHESVVGHTLADLAACSGSASAAELPTLLLIDTAGCSCDEVQEEDGDSRCAEEQASWSVRSASSCNDLAPTPHASKARPRHKHGLCDARYHDAPAPGATRAKPRRLWHTCSGCWPQG
jgi:hypothetical protein